MGSGSFVTSENLIGVDMFTDISFEYLKVPS